MIENSKADDWVGRCQTRKIGCLLANLVSKAGPKPVWGGIDDRFSDEGGCWGAFRETHRQRFVRLRKKRRRFNQLHVAEATSIYPLIQPLRAECSDRALQAQSWLLSLKQPPERPRSNLRNFILAHPSDMSHVDASFMVDEQQDLATLSWNKKELMSVFLEKYLYHLRKKVCHYSYPFLAPEEQDSSSGDVRLTC